MARLIAPPITSFASSGSRRSASAVDPATSANSAVTIRRSSPTSAIPAIMLRAGGGPLKMAREGGVTEGTRTFLFADLRDYTGFVERHGDRAAAALVAAYRKVIRQRVQETSGAEIKVEGDAMFVVFQSARQAIACG